MRPGSRRPYDDPNAAEPFSDHSSDRTPKKQGGFAAQRAFGAKPAPAEDRRDRGSRTSERGGDRGSRGSDRGRPSASASRGLVAASLGTQRSNGSQFVVWCLIGAGFCLVIAFVYWLATHTETEAVDILTKSPVFSAMKDDDPKLFAKAKGLMLERMADRERSADPVARALAQDICEKYVPKASDDAVIGLARFHVDMMRSVRARDPQQLVRLMDGQKSLDTFELVQYGSDDDVARFITVLGELVSTGAGNDPIEVSDRILAAIQEKVAAYLNRPNAASGPPKEVPATEDARKLALVDQAIELQTQLASLPKGDYASYFRGSFVRALAKRPAR